MRVVLRFLPSLFLLAFLLAPLTSSAQVKDEVSDVTDVRRVVSEELRDVTIETYAGNDAAIAAEYESDPDEDDTTWVIAFYGFAENTTGMATASQVSLMVDGRPVQPLRVDGRVRRLDGSIVEIKKAYFTRPVFDRIGRASTVTATIGSATFDISKTARQDMRIILDMIPAERSRRTASSTGNGGSGDSGNR